jgi:hypothetical protein
MEGSGVRSPLRTLVYFDIVASHSMLFLHIRCALRPFFAPSFRAPTYIRITAQLSITVLVVRAPFLEIELEKIYIETPKNRRSTLRPVILRTPHSTPFYKNRSALQDPPWPPTPYNIELMLIVGKSLQGIDIFICSCIEWVVVFFLWRTPPLQRTNETHSTQLRYRDAVSHHEWIESETIRVLLDTQTIQWLFGLHAIGCIWRIRESKTPIRLVYRRQIRISYVSPLR